MLATTLHTRPKPRGIGDRRQRQAAKGLLAVRAVERQLTAHHGGGMPHKGAIRNGSDKQPRQTKHTTPGFALLAPIPKASATWALLYSAVSAIRLRARALGSAPGKPLRQLYPRADHLHLPAARGADPDLCPDHSGTSPPHGQYFLVIRSGSDTTY